jgi:DNA modification methylase
MDEINHIGQLKPDPKNARKHNQRNIGQIVSSLQEVGAARSIVIDEDNIILAGNGVIEAAGIAGIENVRVIEADGNEIIAVKRTGLTPEQKTRLALWDNRASELAEWDVDQLQIEFDSGMLDGMFSDIDLDKLGLDTKGEQPEDAEPQIDKAEELREKWGVESGQLWQLGEHKLICGDCTDASVVDRLMHGERAELAPVDPPYNVGFDYDGSTVDDLKNSDTYKDFSEAWFSVCQSVSEKQIITPGCNNLAHWLRWFEPLHWAPWTKSNSMTNGRVSRFWCWEPVLFFGEKWQRRRANDLFDYPIGKQEGVANHPCPKPLKMWEDLIENYSEPNAIIFECFSGSGTTLIACERLNRKCRAVEISPAYCAVAIQRWVDVTGQEPILVT